MEEVVREIRIMDVPVRLVKRLQVEKIMNGRDRSKIIIIALNEYFDRQDVKSGKKNGTGK